MNAEELSKLDDPEVLEDPLLKAMWYAYHDDWNQAHEIAQDIASSDGSLIHGYLHWVEGDIWNADYWYRSAGTKRPSTSVDEEWHRLTTLLLSR